MSTSNSNHLAGRRIKSEEQDDRGTVAIEAAIALPVVFLMIFGFIALSQLLSMRGLLYDELVAQSRQLSVTQLKCGNSDVIDQVKSDTESKILEELSARGLTFNPSEIDITANSDQPELVTRWNLNANIGSQCLACRMFSAIAPIDAAFNVSIAAFRDGKGCY